LYQELAGSDVWLLTTALHPVTISKKWRLHMFRLLTFIKQFWLLLTVLLLVLITGSSLWPVEYLPAVPGTDKHHHLIAYAALVLPVAISRPKYWLWIVLALFVWGGVIELIQPYVNRWGEWSDLLANGLGVLLGLMLSQLLGMLRKFRV